MVEERYTAAAARLMRYLARITKLTVLSPNMGNSAKPQQQGWIIDIDGHKGTIRFTTNGVELLVYQEGWRWQQFDIRKHTAGRKEAQKFHEAVVYRAQQETLRLAAEEAARISRETALAERKARIEAGKGLQARFDAVMTEQKVTPACGLRFFVPGSNGSDPPEHPPTRASVLLDIQVTPEEGRHLLGTLLATGFLRRY